MFQSSLIGLILTTIRGFLPEINLTGIDDLDLDLRLAEDIKIADAININLYLDKREGNRSIAIITPHQPQSEMARERHSIVALPEETHQPEDPNLTTHSVPFSSGSHLIIDQPVWWDSQTPIHLRRLSINPIRPNQSQTIDILEDEPVRRLYVYLDENGNLTVQIWEGMDEWEIDFADTANVETRPAQGAHWTFEKFLPTQLMTFDTLQKIVLSFDNTVVKEAILITRERDLFYPEYYVLVSINKN